MATNYNPSVVTTNLSLYLDAGNTRSYPGSGSSWNDLSGNGNTATLVNSPSFSSSNGGRLSFNGTNTYCTIPSSSNLLTFGTGAFSVSFWIYLNNINSNHTILTNYSSYNSGFSTYFFIGYWTSGNRLGLLHPAGNWTATAPMTATTWTHVCVTKTGTNYSVYTNGTFIQSVTEASNDFSGSGRTILIGGGLGDFGYLNGQLSNLQIINGIAIPASQVLQNFNAMRGRFGL